jgi:hypothetical protein
VGELDENFGWGRESRDMQQYERERGG